MAKSQLRGNKEAKKPKKPKQPIVVASTFMPQPKTERPAKAKT